MGATAGGNGGIWGMGPFYDGIYRRRCKKRTSGNRESKPSSSGDSFGGGASSSYRFPVKQAATSASLVFTGDTIAQLRHRWVTNKDTVSHSREFKNTISTLLAEHDWIRASRMISYGFLLYGPGSFFWYQFLDCRLPEKNIQNLITKVLLNQVVLGPSVIAVIFAWSKLWEGKLAELPNKYEKDALPTLFTGFRFWIPVSILNFGIVPLQARVAFMSMASVFWNFCLSTTINK
ncbi:protein sym-1 [Primulina eburnea]|uniref:protein sym-1 n=1 Tax=Primulina eburnea TaxID=1245227 RepID=UPI003C6C7E2E